MRSQRRIGRKKHASKTVRRARVHSTRTARVQRVRASRRARRTRPAQGGGDDPLAEVDSTVEKQRIITMGCFSKLSEIPEMMLRTHKGCVLIIPSLMKFLNCLEQLKKPETFWKYCESYYPTQKVIQKKTVIIQNPYTKLKFPTFLKTLRLHLLVFISATSVYDIMHCIPYNFQDTSWRKTVSNIASHRISNYQHFTKFILLNIIKHLNQVFEKPFLASRFSNDHLTIGRLSYYGLHGIPQNMEYCKKLNGESDVLQVDNKIYLEAFQHMMCKILETEWSAPLEHKEKNTYKKKGVRALGVVKKYPNKMNIPTADLKLLDELKEFIGKTDLKAYRDDEKINGVHGKNTFPILVDGVLASSFPDKDDVSNIIPYEPLGMISYEDQSFYIDKKPGHTGRPINHWNNHCDYGFGHLNYKITGIAFTKLIETMNDLLKDGGGCINPHELQLMKDVKKQLQDMINFVRLGKHDWKKDSNTLEEYLVNDHQRSDNNNLIKKIEALKERRIRREEGRKRKGDMRNTESESVSDIQMMINDLTVKDDALSAPSEWKSLKDEATGKFYWYNPYTKETKWDPPVGHVDISAKNTGSPIEIRATPYVEAVGAFTPGQDSADESLSPEVQLRPTSHKADVEARKRQRADEALAGPLVALAPTVQLTAPVQLVQLADPASTSDLPISSPATSEDEPPPFKPPVSERGTDQNAMTARNRSLSPFFLINDEMEEGGIWYVNKKTGDSDWAVSGLIQAIGPEDTWQFIRDDPNDEDSWFLWNETKKKSYWNQEEVMAYYQEIENR